MARQSQTLFPLLRFTITRSHNPRQPLCQSDSETISQSLRRVRCTECVLIQERPVHDMNYAGADIPVRISPMSEAWGMSEFLGCQHFSRLSERFSHRSHLCQPHLMEATYDGQNGTFEGALPPSGERKRGRPFRSYLIMKRSTQTIAVWSAPKHFLEGDKMLQASPLKKMW
jgi:hypothetical protein